MRFLPFALALLLAGCTLVDQRTVARFLGGAPAGPDKAGVAESTLPELPLVVVRYGDLDADYTQVLSNAAEAAMQRKPNAVFEVMTPLPTALSKAEQDQFIQTGVADARAVADTLATAGVPPDQIRLGLRSDPGNPVREVLVFVR